MTKTFTLNYTHENAINDEHVNAYMIALCNRDHMTINAIDVSTRLQYINDICVAFKFETSNDTHELLRKRSRIINHAIKFDYVVDVDDVARAHMITSFEFDKIAREYDSQCEQIHAHVANNVEGIDIVALRAQLFKCRDIANINHRNAHDARQNASHARHDVIVSFDRTTKMNASNLRTYDDNVKIQNAFDELRKNCKCKMSINFVKKSIASHANIDDIAIDVRDVLNDVHVDHFARVIIARRDDNEIHDDIVARINDALFVS